MLQHGDGLGGHEHRGPGLLRCVGENRVQDATANGRHTSDVARRLWPRHDHPHILDAGVGAVDHRGADSLELVDDAQAVQNLQAVGLEKVAGQRVAGKGRLLDQGDAVPFSRQQGGQRGAGAASTDHSHVESPG